MVTRMMKRSVLTQARMTTAVRQSLFGRLLLASKLASTTEEASQRRRPARAMMNSTQG